MERVETIRFINKPASKKRKYIIQQTKEFPHTILFFLRVLNAFIMQPVQKHWLYINTATAPPSVQDSFFLPGVIEL